MCPNADKLRAIGEHAKDFRASKKRVETSVGKPTEASRIREARARVAAVRESQAAAKDAEALIKQRESLAGIEDFVDSGIVEEASPVEGLNVEDVVERGIVEEKSPVEGLTADEIKQSMSALEETGADAIAHENETGRDLKKAFEKFEKK